MEPKGSSPASQEPTAGPYLVQPDESSSGPHTQRFKIILVHNFSSLT
jgi:hypothetical protein